MRDPASTAYYKVTSPEGVWPLLAGTVVVLDTAGNDSADLQPFWSQNILVEVTRQSSGKNRYAPKQGLYMGWLSLAAGETPDIRYAILGAPHEQVDRWLPSSGTKETVLGRWTVGDSKDLSKGQNSAHAQRLAWPLVDAEAQKGMRLFPGCKILGCVLFWVPFLRDPGRGGE
jgi:hypothetical protein